VSVYYNEFEPYAAQWLRNLIVAGIIAPGDVDTRSIVDVQPSDLDGYTQCHFFAGIGGWSIAARLAGWPDSRELWTGSAPCQPFSVAGKGKAQGDDRHLWPHYFRLIRAKRPAVCMGEQVAAAIGKDWLDGVFADLEGIGYACGAAVVPACGVNAPHRRDRLWFVADSACTQSARLEQQCVDLPQSADSGSVADTGSERLQGIGSGREAARADGDGARSAATGAGDSRGNVADSDVERARPVSEEFHSRQSEPCGDSTVGNAGCAIRERRAGGISSPEARVGSTHGQLDGDLPVGPEHAGEGALAHALRTEWRPQPEGRHVVDGNDGGREEKTGGCAVHRAWDRSEWIIGHDGKARRIEPSIRLLAHGIPNRVGRLRAYGNAIVPQVAAEVIGAYMDCMP
jgi:DNA (cytosine-5)-methyltransferase 1